MKHVFNNNVLVLLILGSAGLSTVAQAAETAQAQVHVTATVAANVTLKPINNIEIANFSEGDNKTDIKFTGNSNATVKVEVAEANRSGDKFALKQKGDGKTGVALMNVTLGSKPLKDGVAEVEQVAPETPTTLSLTAVRDDKLQAGIYEGNLTISVAAK